MGISALGPEIVTESGWGWPEVASLQFLRLRPLQYGKSYWRNIRDSSVVPTHIIIGDFYRSGGIQKNFRRQ